MIALGGVFAGKDLWALAVIGIVAGGVLKKPFRVAIVVLVEDIGVQLAEGVVQKIEFVAAGVGPGAVDETDIGIAVFDGL
jgi:hypothetical protein